MFAIKNIRSFFDRKLFLIILAFCTAFSFLSVFSTIFKNDFSNDLALVDLNRVLSESKIIEYTFTLVFMLMISKVLMLRKTNWFLEIWIHLLLAVMWGFFIYFGIPVFKNMFLGSNNFTAYQGHVNFINSLEYNFLIYFSLIGIIYAYLYFQKLKITEKRSAQLNNDLNAVKLKGLQNNIRPHFIFNALNSISTLIKTNASMALNTTADLGDFLRDTLEIKDRDLITLDNELKILQKYIDIISIRYPDQIKIDIYNDEEFENCMVPSMILQPIVENAIKHGFQYNSEELCIEIIVSKDDKNLCLEVKNNGKLLKDKQVNIFENGFGLKYIDERLQLAFDNNYIFTIKNQKNLQGVEVLVSIPCKKM